MTYSIGNNENGQRTIEDRYKKAADSVEHDMNLRGDKLRYKWVSSGSIKSNFDIYY